MRTDGKLLVAKRGARGARDEIYQTNRVVTNVQMALVSRTEGTPWITSPRASAL